MTETINMIREKSRKRRGLLVQQLGVNDSQELSRVLGNRGERPASCVSHPVVSKKVRDTLTGNNDSSVGDETSTYKDSSTFLKGTQSANPHNDYCQHFVDTGQRPQNFIRDVGIADRFEEYPKLKELIRLKDELIARTASPPMYLKCDLRSPSFDLRDLKGKFDVLLLEPPLEEDHRHSITLDPTGSGDPSRLFWSWAEIMSLPIEEIAAQRSFIFLWCGSSDGLDWGRQCLKKWGFRRCEDICWIKTNSKSPGNLSKNTLDPKAIFQRTKQHCLMGIKGTVRRSTDGDFIHANVDIDLIISEEPEYGSNEKPSEIFTIIEHFCLGRRRLHLFGHDTTIRPGWLTIGPQLTNSNFKAEIYWSFFDGPSGNLTGSTERIEHLRPKSPPPKSIKSTNSNQPPTTSRPLILANQINRSR